MPIPKSACYIDRKEIEMRVLAAARNAGAPIPLGEVHGDEAPDFRFTTDSGMLGLELAEVLRPAEGNGFPPVEEEAFHRKVIKLAEQGYYALPNAAPVTFNGYFADSHGSWQDKEEMGRKLAEFVSQNRWRANPVVSFSWDEVPAGFGPMSLWEERRPWTSGECGGINVEQIYAQLETIINAKNELLPVYRANFPDAAIWLLIWSGFSVSRGVPIPHGLEKRVFAFDFDRVFFFPTLDNKVVELRRQGHPSPAKR
jgi:hypothetical protein